MPPGGGFLVETFWELSSHRDPAMSGLAPVTPRSINEWAGMTGTVLRRDECRVLLRMDAAYRAEWQKEADDAAERQRDAMERNGR